MVYQVGFNAKAKRNETGIIIVVSLFKDRLNIYRYFFMETRERSH